MADLTSSSIVDGGTIEASHITVLYDALTGTTSYDNISLTGTASYASTASYAENAGGADTGSLLTTASVSSNTITFTKGDASTFNITVDTGSAVTTDTGSLLTTASVSSNTITFTKGDASTFNLTVNTGSANSITDGVKTLDFDGSNNLQSNTNFLPSLNDTYDLGSATKKWRDLYLGASSIYMSGSGGWMTGSWDGTNFRVNNNALVRSAVTSSMTVANSTTSTNVNGIFQDSGNPGSPLTAPLKLIAGGDTLSSGTVVITTFNGELNPKSLNRDCFITATYVGTPGQPLRVALNTGNIEISEGGGSSNSQVSFIVLYT